MEQITEYVDELIVEMDADDMIGEGEKFAEGFSKFLKNEIYLEEVPNIAYIKENNCFKSKKSNLIKENELITIPYDFEVLNYDYKNADAISIEGGRGCPYNCIYCSTSIFWERKSRLKPLEIISKEMNELAMKKGIYNFSITHDLFVSNREYIIEFCKMTKLNGYRWACSARIDLVDNDLLDIMYDSGCINIFFGIETMTQEFQKIINKKLNLKKLDNLVKFCALKGYSITLSFILGFPFDSEESLNKNLESMIYFNSFTNVNISDGILTPEPGTQIFNDNKILEFDENYLSINYDYVPIERDLEIDIIKNNKNLFSHFYYIPIKGFSIFSLDFLEKTFRFLSTNFCHTIMYLIYLKKSTFLYIIREITGCDYSEMNIDNERQCMKIFSENLDSYIKLNINEELKEIYYFERECFELKKLAMKLGKEINKKINSKIILDNFNIGMKNIILNDYSRIIDIKVSPSNRRRVKIKADYVER